MDRETARAEIKDRLEEYLEGQGIDTRHPFRCLNPDHTDTHPSMSLHRSGASGPHCKCFSCGAYYDTLDLIGIEYNLTDDKAIFEKAFELFGLDVENGPAPAKVDFKDEPAADQSEQEPKHDYSKFIASCQERLMSDKRALEYLQGRGLVMSTIKENRLGLMVDEYNTPRVVIPYSDNYYIARRIDTESDYKYKKPSREEAGAEPLFNAQAIRSGEPVFIVEGPMCAISIGQAGGKAIALGTASATNKLKAELVDIENRESLVFILCLDRDNAGQKAQRELASFLKAQDIAYIEKDIAGGYKDPNELLQAEPLIFTENIDNALTEARRALYSDIVGDNVANYINSSFLADIGRFKSSQSIQTGYLNYDTLTGGLYSGLYVLGAASSLGKTTFIHQMCDQIAASGQPVIYFSLEQSRLELISKSLAREIYKQDNKSELSSLMIRKGQGGDKLASYAAKYAAKIGDRLNIVEGSMETSLKEIRGYAERYIKATGSRPVIVIDYLQVIATDIKDARQAVESNIKGLKIMSRDLDTPCIVISNINRGSYTQPISFESLKESGLIEYSADVVLGLQLAILTQHNFIECKGEPEARKAKRQEMCNKALAAEERAIKLTCIKNRYGNLFETDFLYRPKTDTYTEPYEIGLNESYNPLRGGNPFEASNRPAPAYK